MITDNHNTTRIKLDGSITITETNRNTTIIETNGNTIITEPDDNNTIGNRLGTVETGLQNLENEIDGTDALVNHLGSTVDTLGNCLETSRQNIHRIIRISGIGNKK